MPINSVQTNNSAMVALQTLNYTNSQMQNVQKQVSTGFRVSDASDDGAAFAVAQGIRSTVGSLTSANQQLNGIQGLLTTTQSSLTNISNTLSTMRGLVVKLADDTTSANDRSNYQAQYAELSNNVTTFIKDSVDNGNTLIDGGGATAASGNTNLATDANFASIRVSRNESGGTYTLQSGDANATLDSILFTTAALAGGGLTSGAPGAAGTQDTTAASLITAAPGGVSVFDKAVALINTQLNQVGSEVNSVKAQVSYNSDKMDALNAGVGSLVDADLAKESAQLQALQIRQQLGTQSLAIANQAPAALLSLFK